MWKAMMEEKGNQISKYIIAGIATVLVQYGSFYALLHFFLVNYLISSVLAFVVAVISSFLLQSQWTFKLLAHQYGKTAQFLLFLGVSLANLLINAALMFFLVEICKIIPEVAQLIVMLILAVTGFFAYKFIFRTKNQSL